MAKKRRKPRSKKTSATRKAETNLNKASSDLDQGIATQGVATITEAFALGIGSIAQADAIRASGKFQEGQLIESSEDLDAASLQTIAQGKRRASTRLEEARQTEGTQRAQLAASGVDVNFGSALDLQQETIDFGIEDARVITTNAYRVAFGQKKQAVNRRAQAQVSRAGRKFNERATLISGGLRTISGVTGGIGKLDQAGAFE